MGKILKTIQATWTFVGSKALIDAVSNLINGHINNPIISEIIPIINSWKISKFLGLPETLYIEWFIAFLGISIALLAKKIEEL